MLGLGLKARGVRKDSGKEWVSQGMEVQGRYRGRLSRSSCESELGHTQVVFPTIQDDPRLGDAIGYVGKLRAYEV